MSAARLRSVLQFLWRSGVAAAGPCATDLELLTRFASARDNVAFELLVRRYGPMVLGVCRRVLGDHHDAEDAFQATFLILARKATSLGRREALGAWLHKVAWRAALALRTRTDRQRRHEQPLVDLPCVDASLDPGSAAAGRELRLILDEQVARLPSKYRNAFILCCLNGMSNAEAAHELQCPVGTVESRLARARQRLRATLVHRGIVPAGVLFVANRTGPETVANVTATLVAVTVQAATTFGVGTLVGVSAPSALAQGVLRSMFIMKLKMTAVVVVTLGALGAGTAGLAFQKAASDRYEEPPQVRTHTNDSETATAAPLAQRRQAEEEARRQAEEAKRLADEAKRLAEELQAARARAEQQAREALLQRKKAEELAAQLREVLAVERQRAEEALLQQRRAEKQRQDAEQRALKLVEELRSAQVVAERSRAEAIALREQSESRRGEIHCVVKAVDAQKRTVSVTLRGTALSLDALPLSEEARFLRGGKECALTDLKPGTVVALRVETKADKSIVVVIRAE